MLQLRAWLDKLHAAKFELDWIIAFVFRLFAGSTAQPCKAVRDRQTFQLSHKVACMLDVAPNDKSLCVYD